MEEHENVETEKHQLGILTRQDKPLLDFFTQNTKDIIKEVMISKRQVTKPCVVVVDSYGDFANMAKRLVSIMSLALICAHYPPVK